VNGLQTKSGNGCETEESFQLSKLAAGLQFLVARRLLPGLADTMGDGAEAASVQGQEDDERRSSEGSFQDKRNYSPLYGRRAGGEKRPSGESSRSPSRRKPSLSAQMSKPRSWLTARGATTLKGKKAEEGGLADAIDAIVTKKDLSKDDLVANALDAANAQSGVDRVSLSGVVLASIEMEKGKATHRAWYILDPNTDFMGVWEGLNAIILIFVAVFTPFEVSFLDPELWLFVVGRFLDVFFAIDMIFQFFLMIPKEDEKDKLESNWHVIVVTYLRGWFLLDILALGASVFDYIPVIQMGLAVFSAEQSSRSEFAFLRVVRALRLIKLLRLIKASRIIKSWMVKVATPVSHPRLEARSPTTLPPRPALGAAGLTALLAARHDLPRCAHF